MKKKIFTAFCAIVLGLSCSSSSSEAQDPTGNGDPQGTNPPPSNVWSIPVSDVFDGGPGRDGIPALENPGLTTAANAAILLNTDLVLGYKNGDDVRAYQHIILDWHEIVNDDIGDVSLAVTYCPLTGTGIGWNRNVGNNKLTFGVSGLLYNTNLIPFDRQTNSNWSQILNASVNGPLMGQDAELIYLVETDWATWKAMYPDTKILSLNTGFSRTYGIYPYVDYKTNHNFFLFPVAKDSRLPLKQRVHAIVVDGNARVYQFNDFGTGSVIEDSFMGKKYLLAGNEHFIVSFELSQDQQGLDFSYSFNNSQVIFTDNEGNQWSIFGEAVSGPRSGQRLKAASAFMAYWFSIPAFYPTEIFGQ